MPNAKSLPMPIKVSPYRHQKKAFDFTCMRFGLLPTDYRSDGVALLMEMGTGKTITAIGIAGALYLSGKINRVLVVAPLSILGVWEEEFAKFAAFPYHLTLLHGNSVKPILQIHDELTFIIPEDKLSEAVAYIKACMEPQPFPEFDLPLVAEASAGPSFGQMKEWKGDYV